MKTVLLFCLTNILFLYCHTSSGENLINPIKRVAHAGGSFQGNTYTNSLEALNYNYNKGFEFFEIDFSWTKDSYLVCIHDWSNSFEKNFHFKSDEKPSLETFKFLATHASSYQPCSIENLKLWLKKHPKAKIITDVKEENLKALTVISEQIEDFQNRIIPQCYFPENYTKIRELGYKNIIWTLYRYEGDNQEVMKRVDKMERIYAITMPVYRAKTGLAHSLLKKNIPSYVHTINFAEQLKKVIEEYGITEIYTDFLAPIGSANISESNSTQSGSLVETALNNDCMAKYSLFEGTLYIPCLSMPDSSNPNSVYYLYMQQQSPKLIFKVDSYKLKIK